MSKFHPLALFLAAVYNPKVIVVSTFQDENGGYQTANVMVSEAADHSGDSNPMEAALSEDSMEITWMGVTWRLFEVVTEHVKPDSQITKELVVRLEDDIIELVHLENPNDPVIQEVLRNGPIHINPVDRLNKLAHLGAPVVIMFNEARLSHSHRQYELQDNDGNAYHVISPLKWVTA